MNIYYVYSYREPNKKEPFYIGKGKGNRLYAHYLSSKLNDGSRFHNKLRKMIQLGIKPIIEKVKWDLSEVEALKLEIELISKYKLIEDGGTLCNLTYGGEGGSLSKEAIERMRLSKLGMEVSIETRIKLTYKKLPENFKSKCRTKMLKQHNSQPICKFDLITNQILKTYLCMADVRLDGYFAQHVGKVIAGQRKSHAGYGWRYLTNTEKEG